MSSEPPFEHPPDHRRYEEPPPPQRDMPRFLTPTYKLGCGLVLGFLLTQCCLCGGIVSVNEETKKRFNAVDHQLNEINRKLDEANKKPGDAKKDEDKKDEDKKK